MNVFSQQNDQGELKWKKIASIAIIVKLLCLSFHVFANNNGEVKHYVFNLIGTGSMYQGFEELDGDGILLPAMI